MTSALPLAGITVIEVGHSVAAPYAGLVFAELGAEVIKVERPGLGDDARGWGPPFAEGAATLFNALNRNKRSVEVDLKSPDGPEQVRRLAATADVFLQNLRAGQAEELGLGAHALRALNPRLIYASISAFGDAGPLADRPGYDPLVQAFAGIMSVTGEEGRPSVRVGPSIVDMGSGMWVVVGVLAALNRRHATGEGAVIGTSLFETALGWLVYQTPSYAATGRPPRKQGSGTSMIVPYQVFDATDGEVVVAAGNDGLFRKLAAVLGHPEWAEDERYRTNAQRVAHRDELCGLIAAIIKGADSATWVDRLERAGIPCAPVQTLDRVLAHPQTAAVDILRDGPHGAASYVGLPVRFDGARPARSEPVPKLGEANDMLDDGLLGDA
jgi:crotonobetainyl-CoA:carnitine CoA-transferase CaiB-like acyl-CoA transferase